MEKQTLKLKVKSGLTDQALRPLNGKKVGLVTNQTGIGPNFELTLVRLAQAGVTVAAFFGPEHGYYGIEQAGVPVPVAPGSGSNLSESQAASVPIYSLYRAETGAPDNVSYGPPEGSLAGLDALIFDIQDVGSRYYTYPSTLGILLEQAALPIYVMDRPNPLGGEQLEGPFVEAGFNSFVGRYSQIPVQHGLTIGELARYINYYHLGDKADLKVLPLAGWNRSMRWEDTGWPWLATSPNLPTVTTARLYPGTCLVEGTNLSVGRGTTQPFELVGAPWIDRPDYLAEELNRLERPGLYFRPTYFKPVINPFAGQVCGGVQIHITGWAGLHSMVRSGLYLIARIARLYPVFFEWQPAHFDRLIGSDRPRHYINNQANLDDLFQLWKTHENTFKEQRQSILLYE